MPFAAQDAIVLANPSVVIVPGPASGRELLPLFQGGKPYAAPYKAWALRKKFQQEGILPAGVQLAFVEGDDTSCVVSDGKDEFRTPAWNVTLPLGADTATSPAPAAAAGSTGSAGPAELRAAAEAGDIEALGRAIAAGADLAAEKNGLLLRAVKQMQPGSPHVEFIKHLLTNPNLPHHPNIHADDDGAFRKACEIGELGLAKWLATAKQLSERVDVKYRLEWVYSLAFHAKQQAVLDWLIKAHGAHRDSSVLQFLTRQTDRALEEAVDAGDLGALTEAAKAAPAAFGECLPGVFRKAIRGLRAGEPHQAATIRHLLSSTELPMRADIHQDHDDVFLAACIAGDASLVRWLVTAPELAERCDPYTRGFAGMGLAVIKEHTDILRFLIHECDAMNNIPEVSQMDHDVRSQCSVGVREHPAVLAIVAERKR